MHTRSRDAPPESRNVRARKVASHITGELAFKWRHGSKVRRETAERASDAADALGITAHRLKALGLVDKIVSEPVGGANRDPKQMAAFLKRALSDAHRQLSDLKPKELLQRRYDRLRAYGRFSDTTER